MKKFSTTICKYYSAILVAICGLTNAFSVSAEEYKSMIRYDRVWECVDFDFDIYDGVFKCMRFDGPEEINGRTYHRLVAFKKAYPIYDATGARVSFRIEDCYEHEGYMREDQGKVYTLFVPVVPSDQDYFYGKLYIPDSENPVDASDCKEYLIYDFTVDEGDCFTAMSFIQNVAGPETFKVINVSSVEIDGEECKMMRVGWERVNVFLELDYIGEFPAVAGVGAVEDGCLNHCEFSDRLTSMWCCNYFQRLFDLEGNLLYEGPTATAEGLNWGSFVSGTDTLKAAEMKTAPLYDIMGRRITAPVPGQLYIQGGRKHIAK